MQKNWYQLDLSAFADALQQEGLNIPVANDLSAFKAPLEIAGKTAPNRIAIQPMEGCDCAADGSPTELVERRYHRFARGGAGLLWFEACAVTPESRANPRQMMMTDANLDAFKRLNDSIREEAVKANGCAPLLILQETHSGRYSKPEGKPAPLIAYRSEILKHQETNAVVVTDEYLDSMPERYANTTRLARLAGFDGVDIKACHRYLFSELLAAHQRPGRYGGSYENRTRLMKDCVVASKAEAGDMIIGARMNIYDGYPYPEGWGVTEGGSTVPDMTEPIRLVRELHDLGMTLADFTLGNPYHTPHINRPYSLGGYEPPESPFKGVERACTLISQIKHAVPEMKVIASALTFLRAFSGHAGAGMIENGAADMVGYGRQGFAYPDFANDILHKGAMNPQKVCIACSKCTELMRGGNVTGCVVRDGYYTKLYQEMKKA